MTSAMRALGIGLVVLLAACERSPVEPLLEASGTQVGVLQLVGWQGTVSPSSTLSAVRWSNSPDTVGIRPPRVIDAPDTVQAGTSFDVVVYTVGPSGCWSAAGQTVTVDAPGRVLRLRPLDEHSGSPFCTGALSFLPHRSRVTLEEPGDWTIRVEGRRTYLDRRRPDQMIVAEAAIVVR